MKCNVCGSESGKYPLCRACNMKKEKGEIIKCTKCNRWHFVTTPCFFSPVLSNDYLYEIKPALMSKNEQSFYRAISDSVPTGYCVFPQINLAAFINRTDNTRFHNELFRNVDFLITNAEYVPKLVVEINDQTHLSADRKERDERVKNICEEAGIPILKLWTSYGVNPEYIRGRIGEALNAPQVIRVHHFDQNLPQQSNHTFPADNPAPQRKSAAGKKRGCYIATCVYGSYDCPQVWTLRRYRDGVLASRWYGRGFIRVYYAISPLLVALFGETNWFKRIWRRKLDRMVKKLNGNGFENTPYQDPDYRSKQ